MTSKRIFFGLIAGIIVLLAFSAGLLYYGTAILKDSGEALVAEKLAQAVLDEREVALEQARADIEKYGPLAVIAKSIVPQEKDQARTVLELFNIASQTGVPISSIAFPESALGQVLKKSKNSKTTDPATTQLVEVEGTDGLYAMQITITSGGTVPYTRLLSFLEGLENNRRTAHVTSISITPSESGGNAVSFTTNLNVYLKI